MAHERRNSRPTKRTTAFQGLPVNVEIEVGDVKSGVDSRGRAWAHRYDVPYGELPGTIGADGDPVDVYLGTNAEAPMAYVVKQKTEDGLYDEDKVFLGFGGIAPVVDAYYRHGPAWGLAEMEAYTMAEFEHGYLATRRSAEVRL